MNLPSADLLLDSWVQYGCSLLSNYCNVMTLVYMTTRKEFASMTNTPGHSSPEIPDSGPEAPELRQELELSRSSTHDSLKCRSCGAMIEVNEHMEASYLTCPVCGHQETARGNLLQSSDQGF